MLTLVHAPRSRSSRFLWLLEEIGAPCDIQYVSIRRVDGSGALDPANPHPHGKVPFLKDGASMVFEQTAIALYLADKFPEAHLGPAIGDPARGSFLTALAYYSGVLEPAFTSKFMKVFVPRGTAGWVNSDEAMTFVDARIAAQPYIAGETFTAADVLYAGAFALFMNRPCWARRRPKHSRITWRAASRDRPEHGLRQRIRVPFEPRSETAGHSRRRCAGVMPKGLFWRQRGRGIAALAASSNTHQERFAPSSLHDLRASGASAPWNLSTHTAAAKLTLRHSLAKSQLCAFPSFTAVNRRRTLALTHF